ncbi:MAG: dATP pyrophosphohydrolase [Steroidobacteraceae bacterium]
MTLEIVPVSGRAALRRFIRVPFAVHAHDGAWVPPLIMERKEAFSREDNEFLRRSDVAFWIARRGKRDVGRISAQIDPLAQRDGEGVMGHFGCLSAPDDPEVFAELLRTAEDYLRRRGATHARGPFSLSINEETGLLVDGFDTPPMLLMGHDPPYAAGRLETLGYRKEKDVYAYLMDAEALAPAVRRMLERRPAPSVRMRRLNLADYANEIRRMVEIFNDAWSGNWGFVRITEAEADEMAKRMKMLLDQRLVWFAEVGGEAVAFIVMLPNLNEAVRDLGGHLLPFGWAKLLWRLKVRGVKSARVPLMGVRRSFAGTPAGSTMPLHLIGALMRMNDEHFGFRDVELSWILEDNRPMRHILERLGARAYKTYRVYGKALA